MARPLRFEFSGALYHVTSRGDRREDIFWDDDDRRIWLSVLNQVCERHNWVVYAWCQMMLEFAPDMSANGNQTAALPASLRRVMSATPKLRSR